MDIIRTKRLLELDEGVRPFAYTDSLGYVTIAVGRNIDRRNGRGLSPDEIDMLLENDLTEAIQALSTKLNFYPRLTNVRKAVLISMYHNLGPKLFKFVKTLESMRQGDYERAAEQMLQSRWAEQVGRRAIRLSGMMASNQWPESIKRTADLIN